MEQEEKIKFLEYKLDKTLELLKEIVYYTASTNADHDYLEERINELYFM
jgi:hypothetical protein